MKGDRKEVAATMERRAKVAAAARRKVKLSLRRLEKCPRFRGAAAVMDPMCTAVNLLSSLVFQLEEDAARMRNDDW
jgi:hypothetical protein